mmetsp:Transcript_11170/g.36910  ORF Transcript_11170/g.36910 Transcript_11170/m.36910 type:complete len:336 (+) Transcript_11170:303-1310(+)
MRRGAPGRRRRWRVVRGRTRFCWRRSGGPPGTRTPGSCGQRRGSWRCGVSWASLRTCGRRRRFPNSGGVVAEARGRRGRGRHGRPGADGRRLFRRAQGHRRRRRRARRLQQHDLPGARNRTDRRSRLRRRLQETRQKALFDRQGERLGRVPALAGRHFKARRRKISGHRPEPHVRRQRRDAARPVAEAVRHDRLRQPLRGHPLRRGLHARRVPRHAPLGVPRRQDEARRLRAHPRLRPRHRRRRRRESTGDDPLRRHDAPLRPPPTTRRRPPRSRRRRRPRQGLQNQGHRRQRRLHRPRLRSHGERRRRRPRRSQSTIVAPFLPTCLNGPSNEVE